MKVLIAGMGLIGGSFALALRDRGIADEILGTDSSEENAAEALRLGLADRIVAFEEGIPQADLVVLATPVDTIPLMAVKALNRVNGSQVVMDLGSIKAELCEVISMHARRGRFVAAHPMWGTEYSGPRAAQHGAFTGRNVVLCEVERSDPDALAMAERIFRTLEAPAVYMDAEEHDLHAAYVSHISHITSFALALTVLEKEREERHIFDLAGGGFESTVRLAKSSAATWVPIMLRNKYNLLDVLRELSEVATLAIVSNGAQKVQTRRLAESGVMNFMEDVFISEKMGCEKPNARIFDAALRALGVENREHVLMVGDSLSSDIQGGSNAGLDTCWYNPNHAENPGKVIPTYEIASLEELYPLVMEQEELANVGLKNRRHQC